MNAVKGEEAEGCVCAELLQRVAVLGRVQVEGERRTGGHCGQATSSVGDMSMLTISNDY